VAETALKPENEVVLRPQFDLSPADTEEKPSGESALARMRLLWEERPFLYRVLKYGLVASTLIAFLIPARYESTTRLMPPDSPSSGLAMAAATLTGGSSSSSGGLGGGLGAAASGLLGLRTTSDVFVGILSSRTVQDELIQKFDLKRVYWSRNMEDARKALTNHTTMTIDRKSQIVTIVVTDKSPQRAAAMGRDYVEQLNRLVAELSTSSARRERIFLEDRLRGVTHDLEEAEKQFGEFASKNTALDIKEQGKAMVESAAILQGQLIAAESELEGIKQIYTDDNVRVRSVKARIRELQGQLEKMGGKGESTSEFSSGPDSPLYPSIRKLPLLGVAYADLYRQTKVQEAVFEILTKQYEMAKVEEAKEIPTVKVLDAPDVPDTKSFPPRILIIVFGTILALAGAASYVVVRDGWQRIDPSDPRRALAQEVFSSVTVHTSRFGRDNPQRRPAKGGLWQRIRHRSRSDNNESP
jgi:capsule polysaccharide export protein KpsE/RkpR